MPGMGRIVAAIGMDGDPTVVPVRQSSYVFLFMAVLLVLLLISMVRHMRRARANLAPAEQAEPEIPAPEIPGAEPRSPDGDERSAGDSS